jgi:hypothetical protein
MNLHLIVDYMSLCNMVERMIQWKIWELGVWLKEVMVFNYMTDNNN